MGVGDIVGTGVAARPSGTGAAFTAKSAALSFVSTTLPPFPPGLRSIDRAAGGAGAALPSTNALTASPHPTASIGAPPTVRSTIDPPVAARPPDQVPSAELAKAPSAFASSTWRPGSTGSDPVHAALRVTVVPELVTYTTSRPTRSAVAADALYSSTHSSDAEAPPVTTSAMTRPVDVGQLTAAARPGSNPGPAVDGPRALKPRTSSRTSAADAANRTRAIEDLRGGRDRQAGQRVAG